MLYSLYQVFQIQRMLGQKDDVRPTVGRTERDISGVTSHHLNDRDSPMTFRSGADTLDATSRDEDRRRVSRGDVVNNVFQIENCLRTSVLVSISSPRLRILYAHPFTGFTRIVHAKIIVDGLRRENSWQPFSQRLQSVQCAVTADTNETFNANIFVT